MTQAAADISAATPAGIRVAGTPIGTTDFVWECVRVQAADATAHISGLAALPLSQQDKRVIQAGSQTVLAHLPRTLPVDEVLDAVQHVRDSIRTPR